MNKKIKSCFTGHTLMHSLFGLGIGFIVAALWPTLPLLVLGITAVVVGLALEAMRKN